MSEQIAILLGFSLLVLKGEAEMTVLDTGIFRERNKWSSHLRFTDLFSFGRSVRSEGLHFFPIPDVKRTSCSGDSMVILCLRIPSYHTILKWIRYPIPKKRDLLKRTYKANVYSKFDMKSGFWQIQVAEKDRYKTTFNIPFGQYEWNVMPFGLKNASSEFQNIMNSIFNDYSHMSIVYIDDVLIFS
uniref:RNA-directed DNA polymerase homolog n=1 Tax=Nicotiana tabacum TaxID=4097 RepID=A0A1S4BQK8_TOBAC|nr:PREDICTED: RNA-directed DNA polymerase homolog [Nicotiana tabacum]